MASTPPDKRAKTVSVIPFYKNGETLLLMHFSSLLSPSGWSSRLVRRMLR